MSWRAWLDGVGIERKNADGPMLLAPEIGALLRNRRIWVPFAASHQLHFAHGSHNPRWLGPDASVEVGEIEAGTDEIVIPVQPCDAVYFGVPTIVNNEALFGAPGWTRDLARLAARRVTTIAIGAGAKLIVSGLGSGDISPDERIEDIGGGKIVAFKDFGCFQDWVIARWV